MQQEIRNNNQQRAGLLSRMNGISCVRILIAAEIVFEAIKVLISGTVLFIDRNEKVEEPLKAFLVGYIIICLAKTIVFYFKSKVFFTITSFSAYEETNTNISIANSLIEGCNLFWYIIGFHWLQQCTKCKDSVPYLYYTSYAWIVLGILAFIGPLLAIVALLLVISYNKTDLKTIIFHSMDDLPDSNNSCVICYSNYVDGCSVKFLPCDHHFHTECVDEWFNIRDNCPLCKKSTNMLMDVLESNDSII